MLEIKYPSDKVDYSPLQDAVDRIYKLRISTPTATEAIGKSIATSIPKVYSQIEEALANEKKEKNELDALNKYNEYMDNWANAVITDDKGNFTANQIAQAKSWLASRPSEYTTTDPNYGVI